MRAAELPYAQIDLRHESDRASGEVVYRVTNDPQLGALMRHRSDTGRLDRKATAIRLRVAPGLVPMLSAVVLHALPGADLRAQEVTLPSVSSPFSEQVEARCNAWADDEEPPLGDVALIGEVRDARTREPVSGAIVWVRPAGGEFEPVRAGASGVYLVCGLPAALALEVQASAATRLSPLLAVTLPDGGVAVQDLEVSAEVLARAREAGAGPGARLQGIVRSAETGEPLPGARVTLLELGAEQVTGPDGAFFMDGVPLGRYRVVTEYLGMVSDTVSVSLLGDAANLALFTLETRPIEVAELNVEVERTYANPRIQSFYDRVERGLGDFITREDMWVGDLVTNIRRIPGVRIQECVLGSGLRLTGCYNVTITRGYGLGSGRSGCPPHIYVDDHLIPNGGVLGENPFSWLQSIPRDRIEGIEVHRNPATAPGRYRMIGDACGIILVWTRSVRER